MRRGQSGHGSAPAPFRMRSCVWAGPKPISGIQEAAREARYRLLAAWCRRRFCLHLLAAHHLEDQIETHLIRRRAGSGVDGLAGMSAVRELTGCRLVRPLLAVPRERLAALLAAEGQPFLRDPSNLNPVFERARLRLALSDKPSSPPSGEGVGMRERVSGRLPASLPGSLLPGQAPLSRGAGVDLSSEDRSRLRPRSRRAPAPASGSRESARLDALIARALALHPAGFAVLDPAMLAAADPEIAMRVLSRAVSCLGGLRYPARTARLARLLAVVTQEPRRAYTLGGCRFVLVARPGARLARIGSSRGSDRARAGRRSVLGPALCRLALVASNRRGHHRLSRAIRRRGAGRRFRRKIAASDPFRAARLLGRRGDYGGASSPLCPARPAGSAGAFISARQTADTAELYSCLGSGASYLLLARHLRHWHIGPGAEGVGKGL